MRAERESFREHAVLFHLFSRDPEDRGSATPALTRMLKGQKIMVVQALTSLDRDATILSIERYWSVRHDFEESSDARGGRHG